MRVIEEKMKKKKVHFKWNGIITSLESRLDLLDGEELGKDMIGCGDHG